MSIAVLGREIYMTAGDFGGALDIQLAATSESATADLLRTDEVLFSISRSGEALISRKTTLGDMERYGGIFEVVLDEEESNQLPQGRYTWSLVLLRDGEVWCNLSSGPVIVNTSPLPPPPPGYRPPFPFPPSGRDIPTPRGKYDPAATYQRLDLVRYEDGCYIAMRSGLVGVTPKDGEDYMLLVRDGASGADGAAGKDAAINGVNALALKPGAGISVTQDGDTVVIALNVTDGNEVSF